MKRIIYVNPQVRHSLSDEVWIAVGGNLFDGSRASTFFGQFDRNDNVYVTTLHLPMSTGLCQ